MAIAAIAAPPMASTNFQSASNSFNAKTPYSQMGGSAPGWKSRARNAAEQLPSSANAPLLRILPKPRRLRESTLVEGAPDCAVVSVEYAGVGHWRMKEAVPPHCVHA